MQKINPFILALVLIVGAHNAGVQVPFVSDMIEQVRGGVTASGPKSIVIVEDSTHETAEAARRWTNLRTGTNDAYFADKKHKFLIVDPNAQGPDGKPLPVLEKNRVAITGLQLPVLLIFPLDESRLLFKQSIPPAATAADVMTTIKAHGG